VTAAAMIPSAMRLRIAANNLGTQPAPLKYKLAASLAIAAAATSLADQRDLTEMLGLDGDLIAGCHAPAPAAGELIRAAREADGLTLTEAAAQAGISRGHLSNIEAGRRAVPDGFRRTTRGKRR
jgi:DNA-binding transcriptional regulator YiaG